MNTVYLIKVCTHTYSCLKVATVWNILGSFDFFRAVTHFLSDTHVRVFIFAVDVAVIVNVIRSVSSWHAWDSYLLTLLFSIFRL